ncbi:phosphate acetyltransferase [candidate division KSB1 bacterium]|nr:phosphate acetyltransferase [candidate division KSB1 bacterium]
MEPLNLLIAKAKSDPQTIVFPEGTEERIIKAARRLVDEQIARPILIGKEDEIFSIALDHAVSLNGIKIIDQMSDDVNIERYVENYARTRDTKIGIAQKMMKRAVSYAGMMVKMGDASGMVAGVTSTTAAVIQYASLTIGYREGISSPSSFFIIVVPRFFEETEKIFIFADCAVNIEPNASELADIAIDSARNAKQLLDLDPVIAFLSFSTKGSAYHSSIEKITQAVEMARAKCPDFKFDGELQLDSAIIPRVAAKKVKESEVAGRANVLIFPDLNSGNIGYKLAQYIGGASAYGPILQGFNRPVNDLSRGASVDDIVSVATITVVQAQN